MREVLSSAEWCSSRGSRDVGQLKYAGRHECDDSYFSRARLLDIAALPNGDLCILIDRTLSTIIGPRHALVRKSQTDGELDWGYEALSLIPEPPFAEEEPLSLACGDTAIYVGFRTSVAKHNVQTLMRLGAAVDVCSSSGLSPGFEHMTSARDRVYLVDGDRHRVCAFNADTLQFMFAFGAVSDAAPCSGQRTAPGSLDCPTGVACAGERVFVADCENERIQCFTLEGEYVTHFDVCVPPYGLAATTFASTARVFATCVDPCLRGFVARAPMQSRRD